MANTGSRELLVLLSFNLPAHEMRMRIELKIAVNCLSNFPVVIILTDLRKECLFYWIIKDCIQERSLGLWNGITLIDDIRAGTRHGYLNRCTLAEYFPGSSRVNPGVVNPRHILVLPKVDIMKWLPSPDIGDMRDFFSEMSERKRREWNTRYALNCVMQTPAFNSIYA